MCSTPLWHVRVQNCQAKKIKTKQKINIWINKYKEKKGKTKMNQRACAIGQVSYYKVAVLIFNCKVLL